MIRSLNIWLSAWALVVTVLASAGSAEAQTKRVGIAKFEGQSASAIQAQITSGLKERDEVEIVSAREVAGTASRLGNSLSTDSDFQEVGEALELSAIIEGESERDRKGRDLNITVRVRDASTGDVVHEQTWKKRRSQVKQLKGLAWRGLGPAIMQTSAPAPKSKKGKKPPAPVATEIDDPESGFVEPDEEEAPPARPKPKRDVTPREDEEVAEEDDEDAGAKRNVAKSAAHPALVLTVGPRLMWRKLKYDGDTNLSSFGGSAAVMPAVSLQYYPGAHSSTAWYSNLGLDLDLDYALAYKSKLPNGGDEVSTKAYEVGVGAIYRIPLGDFEPRLRVGYLKQVFSVDMTPQQCPVGIEMPVRCMPQMDYSALRLGLGTDVRIVDWLTVDVAFAYLLVLGTGELDEERYGEDVSTSAWEANAGFIVRFKEVYGVRLGLDYRRYKYDFGLSDNEEVTLPKSGTDGYLKMTLGFVYTLPGAVSK